MANKFIPRLFLITFDLPGAKPGDRRYADVDRCLRRLGTMHKPMKQVRLLVSDEPPWKIARQVRHYIGVNGNATVLRIGRYSVIDCVDPAIQSAMRMLVLKHGR